MTTSDGSESLVRRAVRAARLDPTVYREVAVDPRATAQAFLLVMLVGIVGSLGAIAVGTEIAIASAVLAPLAWLLMAALAQIVVTRVMGADRTDAWQRAARALGFAHAPALLGVVVLVPFVGPLLLLAIAVWRLAAMLVALRAAFDLSAGQAVMTLLLTFVTLGAATFALTAIVTPEAGS